jgi:hypothetical protein
VGFSLLSSLPFIGAAVFVLAAIFALRCRLSERLMVALLLVLGLSLRLFVATRNPLILQYWPMTDDSHYYFAIARNLVEGHGLKHDSFNSTTGFQPLFLFLIAPIFKFIPDKLLAINAVLVFQSLVGAVGGMLLYWLARLVSIAGAGLFALAIWATSPLFLGFNLNGLETNTAILMLLATLYYYFRHFRQAAAPDAWMHVRLGLLCGVSFLARIDLGFLIPILCADMLLRDIRWQSMMAKVPKLMLLGAAATVPMLPWLLYNLAVNGSILPSSGQAIRFLSEAYGFHLLQSGPEAANRYFEIGDIPADYYWVMIHTAGTEVKKILAGTFPLWAGAVVLAAAAALSWRSVLSEMRKFAFVLALLAIIFFSYTCYIFGYWFFDRYLIPFAVGYLLLLFACLASLGRQWQSDRLRLVRAASVFFLPVALGTLLFNSLQQIERTLAENSPAKFYRLTEWLNANTPPDAVIGSFQTGITGYYLERRFYALDGKVNIDALRAMQSKTIDQYVQAKGIDYLADWSWILNDLFTRRSTDPEFLSRQKLVWEGPADVYELRRQTR